MSTSDAEIGKLFVDLRRRIREREVDPPAAPPRTDPALDSLRKRFEEACQQNDTVTMIEIVHGEAFAKLIYLGAIDEASKIETGGWSLQTVLTLVLAERESRNALLAIQNAHMGQLKQRVSELATRLAMIERRKGLQYRGVWRADTEHAENDVVTHCAQAWLCLQRTSSKPGTDGTWRLVSKQDLAEG